MADEADYGLSAVRRTVLVLGALLTSWTASAEGTQTPVDRADPSVIREEIRQGRENEPRTPRADPQISAGTGRNVGMTPSPAFTVGAVRIEGASALSQTDFATAIEPYLGRQLDAEALRALARDVAEVARAGGYALATAWIPPQDVVNGILRVQLDEGRIDAVEVSGPARDLVEQRLAPLVDGRPVTTARLERRLRLAGDATGVTVGQARLVRRGGRNILTVDTAFERVSGQAWLDNWGSDTVGPMRLRVSADVNRLLTPGDQLSFGAIVTPFQPSEFQMVHGRYALPVGNDGTEIALRGYFGNTKAGGRLRDLDLGGTIYEVALGLSHPLQRSQASSLWANFDFSLRDSELDRDDVRLRSDRIAAVSAGLYGSARMAGGYGRVRVTLTQGLDVLGATERGDPLASRNNAGGPFTKLDFWTQYYRSLGGNFSLLVRGEGQVASRPLLSSEERGLGGRSFLRGYDYRELAGDRYAAAMGELQFNLSDLPRPLRRAQLYVYGDAGRVTNLRGEAGGGTLASAGAGIRLWAQHGIEASLELGVPLADGASSRRPDPRLSFTVGARF